MIFCLKFVKEGAMIKMEEERGHPIKKEKRERNMDAAGTAIHGKEGRLSKKFRLPKPFSKVQEPAISEKRDELLQEGLNEFEKQFILECREDGMTDEDIQRWLQEI